MMQSTVSDAVYSQGRSTARAQLVLVAYALWDPFALDITVMQYSE